MDFILHSPYTFVLDTSICDQTTMVDDMSSHFGAACIFLMMAHPACSRIIFSGSWPRQLKNTPAGLLPLHGLFSKQYDDRNHKVMMMIGAVTTENCRTGTNFLLLLEQQQQRIINWFLAAGNGKIHLLRASSSTESLTKHHQQRQTSRHHHHCCCHHQLSPGEYKIRFGR